MTIMRFAAIVLASIALVSCARSLQTGSLSSSQQFRHLVGQELLLSEGDMYWVLTRDTYDPITTFSNGYNLHRIENPSFYTHNEFPRPNGHEHVFVGVVDGAVIVIDRVNEYGMESGWPVALGHIRLADGRVFPFESEWRDGFNAYVRPSSGADLTAP